MSDRGSFVTEFIYCKACFAAAKQVLLHDNPQTEAAVIHGAIIAGRVSGLYRGEELDVFRHEFNEQISAGLCHPIRIAVIAEAGHEVFTIEPPESN